MNTLTILKALLFSIEVICSVLLVGIILIQKSKGGGLGMAFGGGMSESLFGSRAGNVLTKGTVILAVIFMVNTVGLAILFARSHEQTYMDSAMPAPSDVPMQQGQPMTAPPPTLPMDNTVNIPAETAPMDMPQSEPAPMPVEEPQP
jgi:preprotein translocase subunit SecG